MKIVVTTKIMNNDVNNNDDEDEIVVDLDDVNKDVSAKSKNVADTEQIALEQQNDKSLALCFSLAQSD